MALFWASLLPPLPTLTPHAHPIADICDPTARTLGRSPNILLPHCLTLDNSVSLSPGLSVHAPDKVVQASKHQCPFSNPSFPGEARGLLWEELEALGPPRLSSTPQGHSLQKLLS